MVWGTQSTPTARCSLALTKGKDRVHQEDHPVDDRDRALGDGEIAGPCAKRMLPRLDNEDTGRQEADAAEEAVEDAQSTMKVRLHQVA